MTATRGRPARSRGRDRLFAVLLGCMAWGMTWPGEKGIARRSTAAARPGADVSACGPIKLADGAVVVAQGLPVDWHSTPRGQACVRSVAQILSHNRMLRAVTVAYRTSDAGRVSGQALATARRLADGLIAAGLPSGRVFAVAPPLDPGQAAHLAIHYAERPPDALVARISNCSGRVHVGAAGDGSAGMLTAEPAMPVLQGDVIRTGPDGVATVELKDSSMVRVGRDSELRLVALRIDDSSERHVRIEVVAGQVEAAVHHAAASSSFAASSRVAVAAVRGTQFRLALEPAGSSRLETLQGAVDLRSALSPVPAGPVSPGGPKVPVVDVRALYGARILRDGQPTGVHRLPAAPTLESPLEGPLPRNPKLRFSAVEGAVEYRIQLAQDADFITAAREHVTLGTTVDVGHAFGGPPPPGKWFWSVVAVDAAGYAGPPSQVYAFSVDR